MKTLISLFSSILLFLSIQLSAQDSFYVIHLKGKVSNQKTGKDLQIGDQITSNDNLKFSDASSLAVIMGAKGKFTIQPGAKPNAQNEFLAFVNNSVVPLRSNGHLSTRGAEENGVIDAKNYFGSDKFVIVGDSLNIFLDRKAYPMNNTSFFIYRYTYNGEAVVKKMSFNGDTLKFNRRELYTHNNTLIPYTEVEKVDIYYCSKCDEATKNYSKITTLSPLFLDEETLKYELKVQQNIYKSQNYAPSLVVDEFTAFVRDVYGHTDDDVLKKWIKKQIK
jgi:hypothetical protein